MAEWSPFGEFRGPGSAPIQFNALDASVEPAAINTSQHGAPANGHHDGEVAAALISTRSSVFTDDNWTPPEPRTHSQVEDQQATPATGGAAASVGWQSPQVTSAAGDGQTLPQRAPGAAGGSSCQEPGRGQAVQAPSRWWWSTAEADTLVKIHRREKQMGQNNSTGTPRGVNWEKVAAELAVLYTPARTAKACQKKIESLRAPTRKSARASRVAFSRW
ncbi:hypothetical protein OEZ85_009258 [Tetradesmus obliquus]|uniref:Myb/SANT-like DNA-binding domain-containing protein n=1 Tax=Tetradesmus obliquus TaxID=3088 RepID=A0ABY8U8F8_TETOB|nr:hypothetical protein OEZ85_009258 [Tetradesmus obliquus]